MRNASSIVWTPLATFCTRVPFKTTLKETTLIYLCMTMWKSRTNGLSIFITLFRFMTVILLFNQV